MRSKTDFFASSTCEAYCNTLRRIAIRALSSCTLAVQDLGVFRWTPRCQPRRTPSPPLQSNRSAPPMTRRRFWPKSRPSTAFPGNGAKTSTTKTASVLGAPYRATPPQTTSRSRPSPSVASGRRRSDKKSITPSASSAFARPARPLPSNPD